MHILELTLKLGLTLPAFRYLLLYNPYSDSFCRSEICPLKWFDHQNDRMAVVPWISVTSLSRHNPSCLHFSFPRFQQYNKKDVVLKCIIISDFIHCLWIQVSHILLPLIQNVWASFNVCIMLHVC